MNQPPNTVENDNQQQLEKIEIQRRTLEQLFKITRSVENLRIGLETTLLLGKPTGHRSEKAVALYQKLDAKTQALSNHEIHMRLQRIDQKIKKHLKETIQLVEHLDDHSFASSIGDAMEITHSLIDDFKRSAQTMAALRVVLTVRGLPVSPKTFDISQKVLLEKINSTRIKERECRKQLTKETVDMEKDIQQLLNTHHSTEEMRPFLLSVLKGLKANRRHIEQGFNIHELPYEIDQITITDCAVDTTFDDTAPKQPKETHQQDNVTKPPEPNAPQPTKKRRGIINTFIHWVNTPVDLSMKDIFKK